MEWHYANDFGGNDAMHRAMQDAAERFTSFGSDQYAKSLMDTLKRCRYGRSRPVDACAQPDSDPDWCPFVCVAHKQHAV